MSRPSLAKEITAVFVFKAVALAALYLAFFAGPAELPRDAATFAPPLADDGGPGGSAAP